MSRGSNKFEVHQSTIKCWRRCKRQYFYQYVLRIIRRRRASPLLRGTVVHKMIEARANGTDVWAPLKAMEKEYGKLFEAEREYYGDLPGEIRALMTGYFSWYNKDPLKSVPIKPGGKKAEHKFEVELTPSIVLAGKIDTVYRDKRRDDWLGDHKTHKTLPQGDIKYSDIQSALYVWALHQISKIRVKGVVWDYIRWKMPTIPEVLKSGEMSRRKIDTTWPIYKKALVAAELDPADYEDMRTQLEGRESEFYVRQYLPVNTTLLERLVEEAQVTAREMKRKGGHDTTRTIERHCDWCDYYLLCQAELRGLDADYIRSHEYMEKPHEDEELSTVEAE